MKISDIISEAPIQDFKTIGDFSRNSSYRDPRDRKILTHDRTVDIIKKKFDNTDVDFNMYFLNSPAGGRHTEVGEVSRDWIRENLGEEVDAELKDDTDAINIIFTNNKGTQRLVMTPWIIAHRIAHVFSRDLNNSHLLRAYTSFLSELSSTIMPIYGIDNFPRSYQRFMRDQKAQKILQVFMYEVGNFKSARDRNLVNGFEALHEMFAQYIVTGEVTFRDLPRAFSNRSTRSPVGGRTSELERDLEREEYNGHMESIGSYLTQDFDRAVHGYVNKFFVM